MKLRNKKTGEIIDIYKGKITLHCNQGRKTIYFKHLEDLEEWEDYEEPKEYYWYIDDAGVISIDKTLCSKINMRKQIGNYFEIKEEAEKAVEKLKALKRLKDKGFRFDGYDDRDRGQLGDIVIYAEMPTFEYDDDSTRDDLDLLFSGGEE